MKIILIIILCLSLQITVSSRSRVLPQDKSRLQNQTLPDQSDVKTENLNLLDKSRNREIPVRLYSSGSTIKTSKTKKSKLKLAIISHGYGGKNTDYSFIAKTLVAHGYLVASIQHELSTDEPMPSTGNLFEARKPFWERGVQNILFVIQELKGTKPNLDFKNLLLVGHSNGGDMSMLFAEEHPKLARKIISLDNRRMPFPKTKYPRILSIRSSDQIADAGVLPTQAEQEKFKMKIIKLNNTIHNDMWDGASEKQKQEMTQIISSFLENQNVF